MARESSRAAALVIALLSLTHPADAGQPSPAGKVSDTFESLREADMRHAKSRGVRIGMTRAEALASKWGKPRKVNTTITAAGMHEQWAYDGSNFLYFENDKLTSIQTGP